MSVEPLQVGVVGTGFGRYHMDAYSKIDGVNLIAVCDLNEREARYFAEMHNAEYVFTDYQEMFSMDELDAVSVVVPNYLHAPMTIDALNKGKHVLVEKPMTVHPDLARDMVHAAQKADKRLMVEQAMRFSRETQMLKSFAVKGFFGDVYFAKTTWTRRKGWPRLNMPPGGTMGRGEWFIRKEEAGFGALADIGVHLIDLAWYLMGNPKPVRVSGNLWTKVATPLLECKNMPIEVDEFAAGFIRFDNGACITADVCWDAFNEPVQQTILFGDQGGAQVFPPKLYRGLDVMETTVIDTTYGAMEVTTAYQHFIDCIRNPEKPMIASGEENIQLIAILDGIARSAASGKEVDLSL